MDSIKKNKFFLYLNKYKKSTIIKNVFSVASGTTVAQAVSVLSSPLITRIYGPEVFGILGLFLSLQNLFNPIISLSYPIAIVLPKDEEKSKGLVKLSLYIALVLTAVVTVILFFFGKSFLSMFKMETLEPYKIFIPIVILLSGIVQILYQWLIRNSGYKHIARVAIYQAIGMNLFKIIVGMLYPTAFILISITTIFNLFQVLYLYWKADLKFPEKKVTTKEVAKEYIEFPKYRAPEQLFNGITQSLPSLILTAYFGTASVGFYSIGKRVLELPSQLIGKAIGDVIYPRLALASNNKEGITGMVLKTTFVLSLLGIIPFGTVFVFGPKLFTFIFGNEWLNAGLYARWLSLWLFFTFSNIPSVKVLPVISKQKFFLLFTFISTIIRAISLVIGGLLIKNDAITVMMFSVSGALLNIFLILYTLTMCKEYDKLNLGHTIYGGRE